jgi:hypothetical protein
MGFHDGIDEFAELPVVWFSEAEAAEAEPISAADAAASA